MAARCAGGFSDMDVGTVMVMAEPQCGELREFRDGRGLRFACVAAAALRTTLTGLLRTALRSFTVTGTLFFAHGSS